MNTINTTVRAIKFPLVLALAAGLGLSGCATNQYGPRYQPQPGYAARCQSCGVVQQVDQVYVQGQGGSGNGGALGAVIGAVAGGVLGSTIGKGDGRTAATVIGAVGGGVVGNQIGQRNDANNGNQVAWRIVVRMDNGQYATVTQLQNPGVQNGQYVEIRGNQIYPR